MLDTQFPRIVGDIANANTWPFPVIYQVVEGASANQVIQHQAKHLLEPFIGAARQLVARGATGITTSCGFLSQFQVPLSAAIGVPFASSALLQVSMINHCLAPGKRVGVITISRENLSAQHLSAAAVPLDTPIEGTEDGHELTRVILNDEPELDIEKARNDVLNAGHRLVENDSKIGAIVLECTNMTPYAADLSAALGLPVYSIESFIRWFHSGLSPRRFSDTENH